MNTKESISPSFVRRLGYTYRDIWIDSITKDASKKPTSNRLSYFKTLVVSDWAAIRTLWMTAEDEMNDHELPYFFGFTFPITKGQKDAEDLSEQTRLLDKAKEVVKGNGSRNNKIREAVEAWNLGHIEAWRFVRAFNTRKAMVRRQWEREESHFAGAEQKSGKWARWS